MKRLINVEIRVLEEVVQAFVYSSGSMSPEEVSYCFMTVSHVPYTVHRHISLKAVVFTKSIF